MNTSCCFTGHRPNKLNGYNPNDNKEILYKLKDIVIDHIENKQVDTFITGMALGIDMWAGRIVLKLKEKYPHIKLVAAIPCANQYNKWPEKSKIEWQNIINRCDRIHYVSKENYTSWCMNKRNEWMVDNSNYVIAVWDGTRGGTSNCVDYAIKKNKQTVILHPITLKVN